MSPFLTNEKDGTRLVLIPEGEFLMGSGPEDGGAYDDEKPQHRLYLPAFYMAVYPITNAQFARFVEETGYDAGSDWRKRFTPGKEDHPVVSINFYDARAYARWAGLRLPTEAEWEKAARGTDGRIYPWGNQWDAQKVRFGGENRQGYEDTCEVWAFPEGCSPYGMYNMIGNVWEWCASEYRPYPFDVENDVNNIENVNNPLLRGASWGFFNPQLARAAYRRRGHDPASRYGYLGARLARGL